MSLLRFLSILTCYAFFLSRSNISKQHVLVLFSVHSAFTFQQALMYATLVAPCYNTPLLLFPGSTYNTLLLAISF